MRLKIMTTVFNARAYVDQYVDSLLSQTHQDFDCLIVDDASTDGTVERLRERVGHDPKFTLVENRVNQKAIANYVQFIPQLCQRDDDIIVSIDGDDWLYDRWALETVVKTYEAKPHLLLTYGQYICSTDVKNGTFKKGGCRPFSNILEIRKPGFNISHLKTWRYSIWKKLQDSDLRRWDGAYVQRAWDQPLCLNMAEMAGADRVQYIDRALYCYNNENPRSEWRLDESEQMREDAYIRSQKPKERIP